MKYAGGGSLQKAASALREKPRECVRLMAKVACAVQYAHEHGVLHRDLKPGNILLDAHSEPFVTDFGLAKWLDASTDLTRTLTIFGTPGYIAPEQAKGPAGNLTPTADVYSLGAILFDLFTGHPPFLGEHALAVVQQASEKPAPKLRSLAPALDRDLETICARCLEREPQARYRSAADLAVDLERWLEGRSIVARRVSPPVRAWLWAKRNRQMATVTAVALCSVMAAASLFFSRVGALSHSNLDSTLPATSAHVKTIAVLPFKMLNANAPDEYLGIGLADTLITQIGRIPEILARPPSAVQKYAESQTQDPLVAGRELRVEAVLDGTVQRAVDKLRVTARLLRVSDGALLWSGKFDEQFTKVFEVQDSISQEVAKALIQNLSSEDRKLLTKRHTDSPEAYRAYLKGRYFWNKRTPDGFERAAECFNQAIAKDPHYALAYAGLADTYALISGYTLAPPAEFIPKARAAALKALRLDEQLAEAHVSLAFIAQDYDWDWQTAEKEYRRAIELDPNYATAHHWYAENLALQGRFEEAFSEMDRARKLDPLSLIVATDNGVFLYFSRQYERAIDQFRAVLDMEPGFSRAHMVMSAYVEQGKFAEAIADAGEWQRRDDNEWSRALLSYVYGRAGQEADARRELKRAEKMSAHQPFDPLPIALAYIGLKDKDQAFVWLNRAVTNRSPSLAALKVDPIYDSLRSDPRFEAILRHVGLAQ
jgi:serine/threonine-protein kinase